METEISFKTDQKINAPHSGVMKYAIVYVQIAGIF